MTVMVAPMAMTARAMARNAKLPVAPVRTRPSERMRRRTSRGMTPTAAIRVPAVKPSPSDLARV